MLRLWLLAIFVCVGAFAPSRADARGAETCAQGFLATATTARPESEPQVAGLHQGFAACGYELASGYPQAAETEGAAAGYSEAAAPMGRPGDPITDMTAGTNEPATINGTDYSGHALDQMQGRGVTPTVVEDTIQTGTPSPGSTPGTTVYYNATNNVMVVVNSAGKIVTVIH